MFTTLAIWYARISLRVTVLSPPSPMKKREGEGTATRRLTRISRRDVCFRSNSDNYWCHTPTNLSPTLLKSSRERKNARLAAQIMKACLKAKNSVKYHTGKMKGKSGSNRDKNLVIKSICHSTKGLKSQCISQSKDPPIIIEHWE